MINIRNQERPVPAESLCELVSLCHKWFGWTGLLGSRSVRAIARPGIQLVGQSTVTIYKIKNPDYSFLYSLPAGRECPVSSRRSPRSPHTKGHGPCGHKKAVTFYVLMEKFLRSRGLACVPAAATRTGSCPPPGQSVRIYICTYKRIAGSFARARFGPTEPARSPCIGARRDFARSADW